MDELPATVISYWYVVLGGAAVLSTKILDILDDEAPLSEGRL
jgi:hypothetical protein